MARAPKRSARLPMIWEKMATMTKANDCPDPMKVFDHPSVLTHSSVMIETD